MARTMSDSTELHRVRVQRSDKTWDGKDFEPSFMGPFTTPGAAAGAVTREKKYGYHSINTTYTIESAATTWSAAEEPKKEV